MKQIHERHILDCTLRDGGYINNWSFSQAQAGSIIQSLVDSGVDIIECGFVSQKKGRVDSTQFPSMDKVNGLLKGIRVEAEPPLFVIMINQGEVDVDSLPECSDTYPGVGGIRVAFHKKQRDEFLADAPKIIAKGYKLFVQPMLTVGYTDREILDLMDAVHPLNYYAMYIVDTFGSMSGEQFRRYHALFENNLKPEAWLGYHSHNNLQLAYSNAITFLDLAHTRNIIIDSSILGMGRGAGNLNSELLADYMNDRLGATYRIDPLLEVIDSGLEAIKREMPWGYSIAHFLSASLNCHPNYAGFLLRKKNLAVQDIDGLLRKIPKELRVKYDEEVIAALYTESRLQARKEPSIEEGFLKNTPVVMVASGMHALQYKERIHSYVQDYEAKVVALNHVPDYLDVDIVFVTNQKRYDEFVDELCPERLVVTTNLDVKSTHANCRRVDYTSLIENNPVQSDNIAVLFLALAQQLGTDEVGLAGLDGYDVSKARNYNYDEPAGVMDETEMMHRNREIGSAIAHFGKKMRLQFVTPSQFEKDLPLRICGVIPARYESSRYEGKPLALIAGVPMLKRTYDQAVKSKALNQLIVATDDERISSYCEQEGIPFQMTSSACLTGTDRVAEVASKTDYNFYINIQGDEPVIDPRTIDQVIEAYREHRDTYIAYNLYKKVEADEQPESDTVIKVIVNEKDELMYMSRLPVPYEKGLNEKGYFKQVCVYGFTRYALELFSSTGKSPVEQSEDIEILRFLEKGHKVGMVETFYDSIAVDVPEDILKVEKFLSDK
jgi:3-deoxy-D-manno-octulosonate cytidylyltransferase